MSVNNFEIKSTRYVTLSEITEPISNAKELQGTPIDPLLAPSEGEVLVWDDTSGIWTSGAADAASLRGTNIDPNIAPTNGQVLLWSAPQNQWVTGPPDSGDAVSLQGTAIDATLAPTTTGEILVWNQTNTQWEVGTESTDATALQGTAIDATLAPTTTGEILVWNQTNTQWEVGLIPTSTYNITNVNLGMSPYTVLATDDTILVDTSSGPITIILKTIATLTGGKQKLTIIDSSGNSTTNNITIQRGGADTILGDTSILINNAYNSLTFISDTVSNWLLI